MTLVFLSVVFLKNVSGAPSKSHTLTELLAGKKGVTYAAGRGEGALSDHAHTRGSKTRRRAMP